MTPEQLLAAAAEYASDRKALEIVELDLRGMIGYTDYSICTGRTDRQAKAIHDAIHQGMKPTGPSRRGSPLPAGRCGRCRSRSSRCSRSSRGGRAPTISSALRSDAYSAVPAASSCSGVISSSSGLIAPGTALVEVVAVDVAHDRVYQEVSDRLTLAHPAAQHRRGHADLGHIEERRPLGSPQLVQSPLDLHALCARPLGHRQPGQRHNPFRLAPLGQTRGDVGADDQMQLTVWGSRVQLLERIDCVGRTCPAHLQVGHLEASLVAGERQAA